MKTQSAFTAVVTTLLNKHQTGCGTSATLVEKHLGGSNMKGYIKIEAVHIISGDATDMIELLKMLLQ